MGRKGVRPEITKKSGLLDLLEPGDNVMADKGFDIPDILAPIGVRLNIPPFFAKKQQLIAREVGETLRIAALRIHVEQAIGRIKSYHIISNVISLSLADITSDIFRVCALVTNFSPPIVQFYIPTIETIYLVATTSYIIVVTRSKFPSP